MFLIWMPYIRFTDGIYRAPGAPDNINIGPAVLWPDTPEVWQNQVQMPRPAWLGIYRGFPAHGSEQIGGPLSGTIVLGNETWLRKNYRRLIAVVYFLGDRALFQGALRLGQPSECFHGRSLSIGPQSHGLVEIWTKHGSYCEDQHSLKMTPPLPVPRSRVPYRLDLERVEHVALVRLLTSNPEHRIITACVHYFLAQAGDPMIVSFEQDYANYCASLEAAFDIVQGAANPVAAPVRPTHAPATRGIYEQLENALLGLYGDSEAFKEYVRGLYTCRSIHDHGLSDFDAPEVRRRRHQAYLRFTEKRGNYSVCRAMCRDVILRMLWAQPGGARDQMNRLLGYTDGAGGLLAKLLNSSAIWSAIRNRANKQQSAAKMGALAGAELEQFRSDIVNFKDRFDWQCVDPQPEANVIHRVLRVLLDAHTRSAAILPISADSPPIADLIAAFQHQNDSEREIGLWAATHQSNEFDIHAGDRTEVLAAAARCTARFFDR